MNIEFHESSCQVNSWVSDYIRDELIRLHRLYPELSRAQVYFRSGNVPGAESVCELDIPVFGSSFYIRREAASFEEVTRDVIRECEQLLAGQHLKKSKPPDTLTSSVEIEEPTDFS